MQILIIHSRPINLTGGVGGFPVFLHGLTAEFQKLGLKIVLYGGDKSATAINQIGELNSFKVFTGPLIQPAYWTSRKKLKKLINFCRQQNITLIHAQGVYTPGYMVRKIYKATGIPYILTSHSDLHPSNSRRLKRNSVKARYRKILQDAAAITHLSPTMAEAAQTVLDVSHKSELIYNGVNMHEWQPKLHQTEKNYLLAIGRVERAKGFPVLINMYAQLLSKGVTTSLVIAGTGAAKAECRDLCAELEINVVEGLVDINNLPEKSVIFMGYVGGEQKQQLLAQCKCLLFATQPDLFEEPFGIVQLEAMAAAKPIIASDINIVRHLAELGMQVEIVAPSDIHAWANAAFELLIDNEKRQCMGNVNFNLAQHFSWRNIAEQYLKLYIAWTHPGYKHIKTTN